MTISRNTGSISIHHSSTSISISSCTSNRYIYRTSSITKSLRSSNCSWTIFIGKTISFCSIHIHHMVSKARCTNVLCATGITSSSCGIFNIWLTSLKGERDFNSSYQRKLMYHLKWKFLQGTNQHHTIHTRINRQQRLLRYQHWLCK